MTTHDLRSDALGRALAGLPRPSAPPTLLPRVMAAVEARLRAAAVPPAWPAWARLAALLAGVAVCVLAATAPWGSVAFIGSATALGPDSWLPTGLWAATAPLMRALALVLEELWLPLASMVLVAVTATALVTATLTATVFWLVPGGTTR